MSDMNDVRFFRKYTSATQTVTFGWVLSCILNRIQPSAEGVSEQEWGTFVHRVFGLGHDKQSSPSVLARRIRALFQNSPTLVRLADMLEAFADAPNLTQHKALQWLMELETPEKVEELVQNALNAHFNLVLTPEMVTKRLDNR